MAYPLAQQLRQTASYQAATGFDQRDKRTYAAPLDVQCRIRAAYREIISNSGEVTTATERAVILFAPNVGDLINGREVIAYHAMVAVDGSTAGYVAYTR
jgi:hypothetical protein